MGTDAVAEAVETTETQESSFDLDAAVDKIGADLFPQEEPQPDHDAAPEKSPSPPPSASVSAPAQVAPPADSTAPAPAAVPTEKTDVDKMASEGRPPSTPRSWRDDMKGKWEHLPIELQNYIDLRERQMHKGLEQYKNGAETARAFQQVIAPYQLTLSQQGLDGPRAVGTLLSAHARLTTGSMEQRQAAYRELGQSLKLIDASGQAAQAPPPVDPQIQALQNEVAGFKDYINQQHETVYRETYDKAQKEVDAFAADPAHPYFDECHADIVMRIQAGESLQDAYDRAVWANPVTRAKEQARVLTEAESKWKENARLAALPKNKARGVNVTSRDSMRTPTEAAEGTMDDTLKSTLKSIKERTH